jgi:FKBP-type peptidyl-prolyl cis-trans isomerase
MSSLLSTGQEGRTTFSFKLGYGKVIKGWDEGLLGACEGEVRRLAIPSQLG